jgi:hypothetical protein
MALFSRDESGIWTMTLERGDAEDRNEAHDEAVVRYMTIFDKAFTKASQTCEAEFVKALLRVWRLQDAGWDPYETTSRAIPAMVMLHALIPAEDGDYETSRHLALWTYGHIVEATEPYAMLAELLDIANGGRFHGLRFPDVPARRARANEQPSDVPTRPQYTAEKIQAVEKLARAAGIPEVGGPIREVWDRELRNAVFHVDYTIHGAEVRIPAKGKTYSHEDFQTLINRAIAYHEALAMLRESYMRSYTEPVALALHPDELPEVAADDEPLREEDKQAVVMVREGRGLIGLKHAYNAEQISQGAIAWHIARLYPGEVEALRLDPTIAGFPARPEEQEEHDEEAV